MTNRFRVTASQAAVCVVTLAMLLESTTQAVEILDPPDQIGRFKLPPGFEIQLIASDPDIGQPMNLNFDVRGRLWVTSSVEYPYPAQGEGVQQRPARFGTASKHEPRDRVTVIEGIGEDGKPESITHFADGLNIPIGITPIGDGSTAIGYSIPAIYRFSDDDDDGKAEMKRELYGRFGNVDTHGMSNAYTRWIDGWIYGCHGFSNESEITDGGKRVTTLRSGNTYRFREDGSHFQQFTWGQVNPFGLTFDPLGNLYSADCHSKPLYLLLRGAKYPHFGDKADGLGFGPEMIRHNHGSTGICGPAYYAANHFPAEYRNNLFVCNPVTGRINRNKLATHGSTYQCIEQPDFVTYDGDLFRPVDLQVGPDGALYIADFCNPVIGHYEAPLDHPDRDRNHGRVWRIIYRGPDGEAKAPAMMPDLTKLTAKELIELLADPNLTVRMLVTNYLVDAHADAAKDLAQRALDDERATVRAHCLWILERLGALSDETLDKHAEDDDRLVRVHATRILAERETWSELNEHSARLNLFDGDPFVRRAAADALGQHPKAERVMDLLAAWSNAPVEDTHLIHAIRLALRNHVRDPEIVTELMRKKLHEETARRLVEIAAAADSEVAAPIFLAHAEPGRVDPELIRKAVTSIAQEGTPEQLTALIGLLPKWFPDDPRQQFAVLLAVVDGLEQKGVDVSQQADVKASVQRLAPALMKQLAGSKQNWMNGNVPDLPPSDSPWGVRQRASADGKADGWFWDSIAHGEQLTGVLRSQPFPLPEKFSLWMCGHNGLPNTPDAQLNYIRLVHAKTGEVLAKAFPPRNDQAQKIEWKLPKQIGQLVVIEIVDAHRGNAYAWIGVGRFSPPVVAVPQVDGENFDTRLLRMIGAFGLADLTPQLRSIVFEAEQPPTSREAALDSLTSLISDDEQFDIAKLILAEGRLPDVLRGQAAELLAASGVEVAHPLLTDALARAPAVLQRRIGLALSNSPEGRNNLLATIAAGKASPRLLQDARIAELFQTQASEAEKRRKSELLRDLPPANEQIAARIEQHRTSFPAADSSTIRGQALFKKHCANCHRIGDEGGMIGPQLDGVGNRGLERILEDVLDPNRNVDVAFRTVNLELQNGKVFSGIERRREGQVLILADQEGKEIRIALADIAAQRTTNLSLMPSNFADSLPPNEFSDLMAWLMEQQVSNEGTTPQAP